MNAWLLLLAVWAALMAFWFFLGRLFDAIEDLQEAWREEQWRWRDGGDAKLAEAHDRRRRHPPWVISHDCFRG